MRGLQSCCKPASSLWCGRARTSPRAGAFLSPERRFHSAQQPLAPELGASDVRNPEEGPSRDEPVGLRRPRLQQGVPPDDQGFQDRGDPAPGSAQWAVHRQSQEFQVHARDSETRTMESGQECPEVRKGSPTCAALGISCQWSFATSQQLARKTLGRFCWGESKRRLKQKFILDLFAGDAGVSKACFRYGYKAKAYDIRYGPEQDLTKRFTLRRIQQQIKKGNVLAVMLAPVRASFSVAHDRTKVIRSRQYPWGIPKEQMTQKEWESVLLGNRCFRSCLRIMEWLDEAQIPYILENLATSKAWYLPPMLAHLQKSHINLVVADFCQFGTPWKKRTKFMCGNIEAADLHRLAKVCSGRGICCRTKKTHFQLTGTC